MGKPAFGSDAPPLSPHLLSLPYDVRCLIYQHLFPAGEQIYIQALPSALQSLSDFSPTSNPIPTALLRTCHALHAEASEHLYNTYLFNIVGMKTDCLAQYGKFEKTLRRYARNEVHVDAFSNGVHSQTMCVSLRAGEGRRELVERRERGERMRIEELRKEVIGERRQGPLTGIEGRIFLDLIVRNGWALFGVLLAFMATLWWRHIARDSQFCC